MEVAAILEALLWLRDNAATEKAIIFSDSVYAVTGCNSWRHMWRNNGWRKRAPNGAGRSRTVASAEIWKKIDALLTDNDAVTIEWCKGHSGRSGNNRAHELAEQGRLAKR
ncbi:RNase H family protein [Agrobacterium larrymoorei]|uniref:RNase H family protein n=1 Tax=Agrobacterium larrymoorei TaxID=160699 RepID=UPI00307CF351